MPKKQANLLLHFSHGKKTTFIIKNTCRRCPISVVEVNQNGWCKSWTLPQCNNCNKIRCKMDHYNPHMTIGSIIMAIYPKTTRFCFSLLRCKLIEDLHFEHWRNQHHISTYTPTHPWIHGVKSAGTQSSKTPWQDPACVTNLLYLHRDDCPHTLTVHN